MEHPRQGDVVDVVPAALDEAVVLLAPHAVADAADLGRVVVWWTVSWSSVVAPITRRADGLSRCAPPTGSP